MYMLYKKPNDEKWQHILINIRFTFVKLKQNKGKNLQWNISYIDDLLKTDEYFRINVLEIDKIDIMFKVLIN